MFVLDCNNLLQERNLLWIAFQTNPFGDTCLDVGGFEDSVLKMKNNLKNMGFHMAALGRNMRNSQQISNIKVDLVNNRANYDVKLQQEIPHLKSATYGIIPTLIPLNERDKETKLEKVIKELINPLKNNVMVIYDDQKFNSKEIITKIQNVKKRTNVFVYDPKEEEDDEIKWIDELDQFVSHQDQAILVISMGLVAGVESRDVIYLMNCAYNLDANTRCTMLRCVQNLSVIGLFDDVYNDFTTFSGFHVNSSFIQCNDKFKGRQRGLKCIDCKKQQDLKKKDKEKNYDENKNDFLICFDCSFVCHQDHAFELTLPSKIKETKCMCENVCCKIN